MKFYFIYAWDWVKTTVKSLFYKPNYEFMYEGEAHAHLRTMTELMSTSKELQECQSKLDSALQEALEYQSKYGEVLAENEDLMKRHLESVKKIQELEDKYMISSMSNHELSEQYEKCLIQIKELTAKTPEEPKKSKTKNKQ